MVVKKEDVGQNRQSFPEDTGYVRCLHETAVPRKQERFCADGYAMIHDNIALNMHFIHIIRTY